MTDLLEMARRDWALGERRGGTDFVIDMPAEGRWRMTAFRGEIIVASPEHGAFVLKQDSTGPCWEKIELKDVPMPQWFTDLSVELLKMPARQIRGAHVVMSTAHKEEMRAFFNANGANPMTGEPWREQEEIFFRGLPVHWHADVDHPPKIVPGGTA